MSTNGPDEKTQRNTSPDESPSDRSSGGVRSAPHDGFPRSFGPYVLLGAFGKGGMGEVYLARRGGIEGIEKLCVLKLLRADLAAEKEYIGRFLDEARVVIGLQHAHICPVFDVGRVQDALYLAMEYLQGVNLRHVVDRLTEREIALPAELAAYVVAATLAALHHAHRHEDPSTGEPLNVVHRDVSPHNIMITFQGEVKLIDFGLAASSVKREETESQLVMGKVAYMSPEQARGDVVDARTDQFATAIVLYELLTSGRFYGARKTHEIWQVVGPGGYLPERLTDLDDAMRAILLRALAEDPAARYPSCEDFREDLLTWLARRSPTLTERRLRELMQVTFVDEIEGQRAMAQRLLARDDGSSSDDGDPTFSSGPTVTSMLKPGQRAAAVPPDSGNAAGPQSTSAPPSSTSGNASSSLDGIRRAGLTLTSLESDSGTEATLSSTKMAFPSTHTRSPAFVAMSAVALVALVALLVMVVRDFSAAPAADAMSVLVNAAAPDTVLDDAAPPAALTAALTGPQTPVIDETASATASLNDSNVEAPENDASAFVDDGSTVPADDDAPLSIPSRGRGPTTIRTTPRPVAVPAAPTPPTPLLDTPGISEVATEVQVSPQTPPVPTTASPVDSPLQQNAPTVDALYTRLARCPSVCAKKIVGKWSLADLEKSPPDVVDAFRLLAEPCAARCPR